MASTGRRRAERDPFGLGYQLGANYCGGHEPVAILAHLICPRPEFLDRGKANLARHTPGYHASVRRSKP